MNQNNLSTFVSKKAIAMGLFCLLISFVTSASSNSTILVMGDSLSAEYGISRGSGWVKLLEGQLQKQGSQWTVFNASISGETSSGGLARITNLLQQKKPGTPTLFTDAPRSPQPAAGWSCLQATRLSAQCGHTAQSKPAASRYSL